MAMRKVLLVASVSLLSWLVSGCESLPFGGTTDEASPSAETSPSPTAEASPTPSPGASPSPESFQKPVVTPATNLLQSTNPNERAKQVQAQISANNKAPVAQPLATVQVASAGNDPFAALPITTVEGGDESGASGTQTVERSVPKLPGLPISRPPQLRPSPTATGQRQVGQRQAGQRQAGQGTGTSTGTTVATNTSTPSGQGQSAHSSGTSQRAVSRIPQIPTIPVAANPRGVPDLPELPVEIRPPAWVNPNPPAVALAPPPPDTSAATGIEVTGVVRTGKEIKIIVKAPGEATSRYVNVGQRISNGDVLVKRVDNLASGQEPIVIFEQNGVEVAKALGAESIAEETPSNLALNSDKS